MVAYPSPSVLSYIQKGAYRCKGKTVPRGGPTDTETSFGLTLRTVALGSRPKSYSFEPLARRTAAWSHRYDCWL